MVKGTIEADSGHIGGANISKNSIYADNNKWYINSDGSAGFSNIKVTGGSISGTTISNGNGTFYVDSNGNLTCNNISSIGLIRGAIPQFSSLVHDSEAHQLALQAIALAQSAADTAKQAADDARDVAEDVKVHVMNINDTIIPDILGEIRGLDGRITALENNS